MQNKRTLVIINPNAKGTHPCHADRIARGFAAAGVEATVETSATPDRTASEARTRGFGRVVAVGGDGTLRSIACAAGLPVGLLPAGTSNSVARSLGIPLSLDRAIEVAARGIPRRIDLGRIEGPRIEGGRQDFLLCASAGVDAEAARRYEVRCRSNPSVARYVLTVIDALARYDSHPITVTVGAAGTRRRASVAIASNMRIYGGWFVMAPDALPHDGALDLIAVRSEGTAGLCGALGMGLLTRPQSPSRSYCRTTTAMRWESSGPVPVEIDGEPVGWLPVEVSVLPGAIEMVLPA
jgi:diacylglycerol kinase (ATP)